MVIQTPVSRGQAIIHILRHCNEFDHLLELASPLEYSRDTLALYWNIWYSSAQAFADRLVKEGKV